MSNVQIITLDEKHRVWANNLLMEKWGSIQMVSRGVIHQVDKLPGLVALLEGKPSGLATYNIEGEQCEIVTLNSLVEKRGIGNQLIKVVSEEAKSENCRRLWLITTNDNTDAFRFYQKSGFVVAAYHIGSIEQSRKLKPGIPFIGMNGINIRDEIELELKL